MTEIPLSLTGEVEKWPSQIDHIAAELGLSVTLRDTLKSFPGSIHWHLKQGKSRGVLEVTVWKDRAWLSVQDGRTGDWIDGVITKILALV